MYEPCPRKGPYFTAVEVWQLLGPACGAEQTWGGSGAQPCEVTRALGMSRGRQKCMEPSSRSARPAGPRIHLYSLTHGSRKVSVKTAKAPGGGKHHNLPTQGKKAALIFQFPSHLCLLCFFLFLFFPLMFTFLRNA